MRLVRYKATFHPRRAGLLAALVAACGTLVLGLSGGLAATPGTPYDVSVVEAPNPQSDSAWGERMAVAGDLTGDGVKDLFVATPSEGGDLTGRVRLLSGSDRSVVRVIDPPDSDRQAFLGFGYFISVLGDVDGDGKDDLAVGSDPADPAIPRRVWVFSGSTGDLLYRIANPEGTSPTRFGRRVGRAGDVSKPGPGGTAVPGQDGAPDIVVGDAGYDQPDAAEDRGRAYIFDGRTGALLRPLDVPAGDLPCDRCNFGAAVQGPGDVDGDGVDDQLVDATQFQGLRGRMYLFSGKTGGLIRSIDDPEPDDSQVFFGFQDVAPLSPGDVNGDGFADVYGGGFEQDGPAGQAQGKAWVFSGKTGDVLYALEDPTPTEGGQFGWSMTKTTDYNGDGRPDLYIGQAPHHSPGDQNGGTYVLDGQDGSLLKALELPTADRQFGGSGLGPNLGWSIAAPGDLNGDGEPDFLAAAPFYDVGPSPNQGRVYAFLSGSAGVPPGPTTQPPGVKPPAAGPPSRRPVCAKVSRFSRAGVRPRGRGVRLVVAPRPKRPVMVDIFQVSRGRSIGRFRRVASFRTSRSLTWSGRSNLPSSRRVTDGYYVVQMRSRAAGGGGDVRRFALKRSQRRFSRMPRYTLPNGCGTLSALRLASPVFGGRQQRPLRIGLRLRRAAAVSVELRRGKRVVRRTAYKTIPAESNQSRAFSARGLRPGTYAVVVRIRRTGQLLTRTVYARRL